MAEVLTAMSLALSKPTIPMKYFDNLELETGKK